MTLPHIENLLPYEGAVEYLGVCFERKDADRFFNELLNGIAWQHDEAIIFGRHFITKRKVAWYGDQPFEYTYSNVNKRALPWTPRLKEIKATVERISNETYNSCLLNLYHDGSEGMAWHSDGEPDLLKGGTIASVTLGAVRKFSFKHKRTKETVSLPLEHGSLLLMKGTTQENWLHRLPPTRKVQLPRVNLTFRTVVK